MSPEQLRAFVRRDFARVERAKLEHWKREHETKGALSLLNASEALAKHAARLASVDASAERALDLAHHVRLKQRIDAANRRLGR